MEEKHIKVENLVDEETEAVDEEELFLSEHIKMEYPLENYEWKKDMNSASFDKASISKQSLDKCGSPIKQEKEWENQQCCNEESQGNDVELIPAPFQFVDCSQPGEEGRHLKAENFSDEEHSFSDGPIKVNDLVDCYEWNKDRKTGPAPRDKQHRVPALGQRLLVGSEDKDAFWSSDKSCKDLNLQQGGMPGLSETRDVEELTEGCVSSSRLTKEPSAQLLPHVGDGSDSKSRREKQTGGGKPFECDVCKRTFRNKTKLMSHKFLHTGAKPFGCDQCKKFFRWKHNLVIHQRAHTGEKPFECDLCKQTFSLKSTLRDHKKVHSGKKPFKCDVCQKSFARKRYLTYHKRVHSGEKPFVCDVCGKPFTHRSNLADHKKLHTGEKLLAYDQGEVKFWRERTLTDYDRVHGGENPLASDDLTDEPEAIASELEIVGPAPSDEQHSASFVEDSTSMSINLQQGRLISPSRTDDVEELAEKCVSSSRLLREPSQHLLTHVADGSDSESRREIQIGGEKLFECDMCDKTFRRKYNLVIHKQVHTGVKPFRCDTCKETFSHKCSLMTHQRAHTGVKPFQCDDCKETFSRRGILVAHKRTHTGEKPFKCDHCEKAFSRKHDMVIHKQLHSGKKPFKCDQCEKTFTRRRYLETHKWRHTLEKPFKCDQCEKEFIRKHDMTIHKLIHLPEKQYKCDQCQKEFLRKHDLAIHKQVHTGEKPFKCDLCSKQFFKKKLLVAHKRVHSGK